MAGFAHNQQLNVIDLYFTIFSRSHSNINIFYDPCCNYCCQNSVFHQHFIIFGLNFRTMFKISKSLSLFFPNLLHHLFQALHKIWAHFLFSLFSDALTPLFGCRRHNLSLWAVSSDKCAFRPSDKSSCVSPECPTCTRIC